MKSKRMAFDLLEFDDHITTCKACQIESHFPSQHAEPHLEVAGVFWKFKKTMENQSDSQLKILRFDNGKGYTSGNFNAFCEITGIEYQLIAVYTPQKNGVSERRNKYILELTRCMLHKKNLPK
ncbi:Retrovirus-related Pol polyprotein from transposon TNT 1-94 [Gossypium australe]|uniref:Retrovirus-related Pol polyprotein from transposon TNT 1-94 n=1 Tax=Gossypium australe TaxID=47621 RepID=A0A5B6UZ07_9ROSI|nr:Retrovirus-related Pol polyprotein from transposon TNT 1-94 [Gossypium australe]